MDTHFDIVDGLMSIAKARAAGTASWCQAPTRPIKDSHWPRSRWRLCPEPDPCIVQSRGLLLWWQRRLPAGCLLSAAKPMTLTGSSPKAQPRSALRLARAAAGMPISTAAAVCGLTDRTLRKHLRNLPARGRCAATVAALAAAQKRPDPPDRAAVTHRACPPPAVRAARPGDLDTVAATAGSASWALAHLPIRGGLDDQLYVFSHTQRPHRSVMTALAAASNAFCRRGIAENRLCPPVVLQQLAHDPNEHVRAAAAHTLRRCCCGDPDGRACEVADFPQEALRLAREYLQEIREEDQTMMSLRDLRGPAEPIQTAASESRGAVGSGSTVRR